MEEKIANNPGNAFIRVISFGGFRHLWIGQVASQLAFSSMMFVLSLHVYQLTGSNTAVSLLFLTFAVPALFLAVAAGAIDDYMDNRSVLVACDLFRAIVVIGFIFFPGNLPFIYGLAFILAVVNQFYIPAEVPTIPLVVPRDLLLTANSLFAFTYYSSLGVGSMIAGPLLRWFGPHGVFIVISILFAVAASSVSRVPKEKGQKSLFDPSIGKEFSHMAQGGMLAVREGIAYVASSKAIRDALLLLAGTQVVIVLLGTLGPGFADRVLKIDVHDASLLIVGPVVAGIVMGALWVGTRGYRFPAETLIRIGIAAAGLILMFIALTVRLERVEGFDWFFQSRVIIPIEFFLFFLLGVASSMLDAPANSVLQRESTDVMRSRVYGILTAAVGGVGILPVVISGMLADVIGEGKVIFLLGLVISLYGLWRVRYNKS